ncbi:MAG: response regulator [Pseudomonadota bacterium]
MSLNGLQILLAEDNLTNQMVAVQMLEALGAQVTVANDGAEALERLDVDTFDVALIDIEMPRVSGLELIERLRADPRPVSQMPLIALTAYVMREHRAAIDKAGADGIIAKPILSIDQFGEDVRRFMTARETLLDADEAEFDDLRDDADLGTNGIDTSIFNSLCAAFDGPARNELLQKIAQDIGRAQEQVRFAAEAMDFKDIRAATHVLMSVGGAIGALKVQELARCLNSAGHAEDTGTVERDGPELLCEIDRVLSYVRSVQRE